jgi:hypothetical protein
MKFFCFGVFVCLFCLLLAPAPATAQVNLSGVWDNLAILHEDWPDRLFGPELGDYTGVPLTDDARFRADAWDASLITRVPVPGSSVRLRTELCRHADLGRAR